METSPIEEFLDEALEKFELVLREAWFVEGNVYVRARGAKLFVEFLKTGKITKGEKL